MNRPYQTFDSTQQPLTFDGLQAVCWFIVMRSNVTSSRMMNISPGQLYTFVFTQDNVGGRTFSWPANCIDAAPISPAPNTTTVQNLVGHTGAVLYANIPPTAGKGKS